MRLFLFSPILSLNWFWLAFIFFIYFIVFLYIKNNFIYYFWYRRGVGDGGAAIGPKDPRAAHWWRRLLFLYPNFHYFIFIYFLSLISILFTALLIFILLLCNSDSNDLIELSFRECLLFAARYYPSDLTFFSLFRSLGYLVIFQFFIIILYRARFLYLYLFLYLANMSSSFQRPLLIILDRNEDLSSVLAHSWTYQALVHDLFSLDLNRIQLDVKVSFFLFGIYIYLYKECFLSFAISKILWVKMLYLKMWLRIVSSAFLICFYFWIDCYDTSDALRVFYFFPPSLSISFYFIELILYLGK